MCFCRGLPSQAFEYIRYNKGIMAEDAYPYKAKVILGRRPLCPQPSSQHVEGPVRLLCQPSLPHVTPTCWWRLLPPPATLHRPSAESRPLSHAHDAVLGPRTLPQVTCHPPGSLSTASTLAPCERGSGSCHDCAP